jgi:hypothetical protein
VWILALFLFVCVRFLVAFARRSGRLRGGSSRMEPGPARLTAMDLAAPASAAGLQVAATTAGIMAAASSAAAMVAVTTVAAGAAETAAEAAGGGGGHH